MKKLLIALLPIFCAIASLAQTCTLRPQSVASEEVVACSLPRLQTNQCVHYVFSFESPTRVPVDELSIKLNTSVINSVLLDGPMRGKYSVEGRFCAAEDGTQYFFNLPAFHGADILTAPTSGSVSENTLTQTSVLSFFFKPRHDFDVIQFTGGIAEVGTLPPPLP